MYGVLSTDLHPRRSNSRVEILRLLKASGGLSLEAEMATLQEPGTSETAAVNRAERPRVVGHGPDDHAAEAVKHAVTGPAVAPEVVDRSGVERPGVAPQSLLPGATHPRHHNNGEFVGRTEEELAHLRSRSQVTNEGEVYCPNPNIRDLPKEFETRVTIIQRYPEMRTIEKTDFVKEIHHEDRTIRVPKTRVVMDEVEHIDRVPVVRQVPKTRIEIVHRVVTEEREVTDIVQVVEYIEVPRIEMVPRVITEAVEERVIVPVVREVPVTRMVEVPTGNYVEAPVGEFVNPGDFNLLSRRHRKHKSKPHSGRFLLRSKSSSSSSTSDDEKKAVRASISGEAGGEPHLHQNPDGTTSTEGISPSSSKRKSLLQRIIHH
ncbi:uncharacterized protein [Physcomitrium patens]|uniref:Uncharacterized protein n=1 Tax=Physcomitrium patens TaxID=3218 RepID=A0A2K1JTC5_PHYPA|nr:uncharacterized protein LOC112289052 isoform X1 [Physcomitrium patens]PNR44779.1 hypothetical protein PHYPA_014549 [Physcomitrium patens]|eukprot:XP_024389754.1 uncharacterized protein LOC112289052 isoform X1 [Physcomitrella patens]